MDSLDCTDQFTTPKEALEHILENRNSILKILKSVQKARDAKTHCKKYVLCVKDPTDNEMLLVPGEQILEMYNCGELVCDEYEFVFSILRHVSFFSKVFTSIERARKAHNECKDFCACINIPSTLGIFECVEPKCIKICKDILFCPC